MNDSFLLLSVFISFVLSATYEPTWESLDSRPIPSWYEEAKFGIFVHWGLYSIPSYGCSGGGASGEWYWWVLNGQKHPCLVEWHEKTFGKNFQYQDFGSMLHAPLFDADNWAQLFKHSGAKYVVFTSKHHEGFAHWPSPQSWNWNSVDNPPHRDNVKLITDAVRKAGLRMGLYYSLFEWFNPLYLRDKGNKGQSKVFVNQTTLPQLHDIVHRYKPDIVWSDGDWEMKDDYWQSREFLAWLYNESPVKDSVCVNDRWGSGVACKHGGYYTCTDRYNPGVLQDHKWENCLTIDKLSWGYRRNANMSDMMTIEELLRELAMTVSCGGNMLLNVGPTAEGTIIPIFQERLLQMGAWLKINGESIYATTHWRAQNDTDSTVWYTKKKSVYAILLQWPENDKLELTEPKATSSTAIEMLGLSHSIQWEKNSAGSITIHMPRVPLSKLPNPYAWVFKMDNIE